MFLTNLDATLYTTSECALNLGVVGEALIYGHYSPSQDTYADITDYDEIRVEGTPGTIVRFLYNRIESGSEFQQITPTIGDDGKLVVNIKELPHYLGSGTTTPVDLSLIHI